MEAHKNKDKQNLYPIVQGGLHKDLRKICVDGEFMWYQPRCNVNLRLWNSLSTTYSSELLKRDTAGYAIGGLSGGESKDDFWKMVDVSTDYLPDGKPRYLMGVGFAVDLVVCAALG